MQKKTKIIVAVSAVAAICLVFAGIIGWQLTRKTATARVVRTASTAVSAPDTTSTLGTGNNDGGLGGGTELSNGTGQAQAGATVGSPTNSNSSTTPAAPTIPGPESFGQYEQYKDSKSTMFMDLQVGTGAELAVGKKAAVLYKVWLTNGTLVDQSSLDKPGGTLQPLIFTLGDHTLIPGWEQGIFGMKVNGVRRMVIPSALAYGAQGNASVPPNSMLVIDVQLLQIQ